LTPEAPPTRLLDRRADLIVGSAIPVHDNERHWRAFSRRIDELRE
jgi:hypothetical protein